MVKETCFTAILTIEPYMLQAGRVDNCGEHLVEGGDELAVHKPDICAQEISVELVDIAYQRAFSG